MAEGLSLSLWVWLGTTLQQPHVQSSPPSPATAGMGGACRDYSDRPIAAAAPPSNGTAMFDNGIDYSRWSKLKGALGAPAFSG